MEGEILTPTLMKILFATRRAAVERAKEQSTGKGEEKINHYYELDFFLGVAMSCICGAIIAG
jgi:hypothetical protein